MEVDQVLSDMFEDVHWILLVSTLPRHVCYASSVRSFQVAGNVISLDVDGETALIPSEVKLTNE